MVILDERKFITAELENKGFQLFDFYENHQVVSVEEFCQLPLQRRADILLVDTATILTHPEREEAFKTILNTFLGVIFFHDQKNEKAQKWVQDQASFLTKIVGEFSLPMAQLQWTMLSNQLQFFWNILEEQRALQRHMLRFSQELDQVLQTAEVEMTKAKRVHEVLIPKRNDEIKGVFFSNKYAAGNGGGGEFYDLHQQGQKVYQIMISSQSYLISSALIGLLNHHKKKEFNVDEFLKESVLEVQTINGEKKKKSEINLLVLEMDTNQLTLKSHGWGHFECISGLNGKVNLGIPTFRGDESNKENYQLAKNEKMIVFSPGFLFNWKESNIKQNLYSFVKSHQQLTSAELLMELFFQIKKVEKSEFLSKDATVVMMEVNRHGIHKI